MKFEFHVQREQERERQKARQKNQRKRAMEKKRNLGDLLKDAEKRSAEFDRKVGILLCRYVMNMTWIV